KSRHLELKASTMSACRIPSITNCELTVVANEARPFEIETTLRGLTSRAHELYAQSRFQEAADIARHCVELNPTDPELWNMRGVFLRSAKNAEAAIPCYRRCLDLKPSHSGAWSNLGNAFADLKQVALAAYCHRRAIALKHGDARFHHNLAVALALS